MRVSVCLHSPQVTVTMTTCFLIRAPSTSIKRYTWDTLHRYCQVGLSVMFTLISALHSQIPCSHLARTPHVFCFRSRTFESCNFIWQVLPLNSASHCRAYGCKRASELEITHPLASIQNCLGCTLLQHPTSHTLLTSTTPCQREFVCGALVEI